MELKGIDLSYSNGNIDWNKVKKSNIDFAIIRMGYGLERPNQIDKQFELNYIGAKSVNIPLGAYHYSYAKSIVDAKSEADFALKLLHGKQFEFPIFFDIEEDIHVKLSKSLCTEIVRTFCNKLESEGYWAGVYSFDSFFSSNLDESITRRYTTWVARTSGKPTFCKRYDLWQYSWKASIPGSSEKTDINICYSDFEVLIKKARKNGFFSPIINKYSVIAESSPLAKDEAKNLYAQVTELGMKAKLELKER